MLDFGRIVLNFYFFFLLALLPKKSYRDEPVDVSLQIVKLSEGLNER
jgi:hypothetical protein